MKRFALGLLIGAAVERFVIAWLLDNATRKVESRGEDINDDIAWLAEFGEQDWSGW